MSSLQITAKVADFDLARHVDPSRPALMTLITFADEDYLPPEAIDEETVQRKETRTSDFQC